MEPNQNNLDPYQPQAPQPIRPDFTQPAPPPPPTPSQPVEIKETRKLKWTYVLIVFLILVILGLVGFILMSRNKTNPTPTPEKVVVNTPSPSPDPMANWENYDNNRFGFSMRYPNDFQFKQELGENRNIEATQETALYQIIEFDDTAKNDSNLIINLGENSNFPTNESYINFIKTKRGIKEDIKDINIDGISGVLYTYIGGAPGTTDSFYNSTLEFAKNSKTYTFTLTNLESDGSSEELLKEIASTIKFTN